MDLIGQKKVILKMVKSNAHQAWFAQFRMEVQVLKRLNHPRIPTLIESHDDWDGCWLVEEYIAGMNLNDWLKTDPEKKYRQTLFFELLELIQCVHQVGFLYLDLKVENVLVVQGHPYLIDFNSCLPLGSTRPILVNSDSLPPEGLAGQIMDEKADQIGLGKLYLLFFGPDSIAWMALRENPKERFSNLEAFQQAMESSLKKPYLRPIILVFFGFLAFFSLFTVPSLSTLSLEISPSKAELGQASSFSLDNDLNSTDFSSPFPTFVQNGQSLKASDLCLQLQRQSDSLTPFLWLTYAYVAIHQNHLSLAGYLYENSSFQEDSTVRLYRNILGLFINKDIAATELSWCVQALPLQESWLWFLEEFCIHLWQRELNLSFEDYQALFFALDQEDALPQSLLEVFMQCVLIGCDPKMAFTIPTRLQNQFKTKTPELYGLYIRSQSSF